MGTSARNFWVAIVAAVLLHMLLLVQTLVVEPQTRFDERPLAVTMLKERVALPPEPKTEEVEVLPNVVQAVPPKPQVDKLIVATKPSKDAEPRVVIKTSQDSTVFKSWLKSETDNFTNQNPESIGEYDQTFTEPSAYRSPEELSIFSSNPIDVRGRGDFMTEDNGKRTCYVRTSDLLDISASSAVVSRDCTPDKKIELKLNQPNNGWTDR